MRYLQRQNHQWKNNPVDLLGDFIKYGILPLLTVICTMAWHMYKKHEQRIERLEEESNEMQKIIIEIKTDFKYVSIDIRDIKDMLHKLADK